MREGQLFNGNNFEANLSLAYFKKKNFGFSFFFVKLLMQRFELNVYTNLSFFYLHQWLFVYKFLLKIVPKNSTIKKRKLLNIFFLDLIASYRGWRHGRGLPTRGQRTWTNANSAYKSNLSLRYFKINAAKKIYNSPSIHETTVAYLAEQMNLLWKLQWEKEWADAKKKRNQMLKKKTGAYKIDLYSMAKGQISTGEKNSSKKKNKKKKEVGKNTFLLGFDPGFTKKLLRKSSSAQLFKTKKYAKIQILTSKDDDIKKKKLKKKTQVVQKTAPLKKKKNLNWD